MLRPVSPLHVYLLRSLQVTRLRSWMARQGRDGKINCRTSDIPSGVHSTVIRGKRSLTENTSTTHSKIKFVGHSSWKSEWVVSSPLKVSSVYSSGTVNTRTSDFKNDIVTFPLACAEVLPSWLTLASPALTFTLLVRGAHLHMHVYIMGELVVRVAKMEPEVVQALREEPGVDSALPLDAPADGVVFLVQFQAGNLDCMSVRLGVRKLGLRRALPVPLSQHGIARILPKLHVKRLVSSPTRQNEAASSSSGSTQHGATFAVRVGTMDGVVTHHLRAETRRDLAAWARAIVQGCHTAAHSLREYTVRCTWQGKACQLVVNHEEGFALYSAGTRGTAGNGVSPGSPPTPLWRRSFDKLKMSADDGARLLWLDFGGEDGEIELDLESCPKPIVFVLHNFLSAKIHRLGLSA
ncbi:Beta-1-syntrophin [Trachymyrmex zeteki]|uniref:Beta-1-syntrophin n=1 Tax=Mycetomoellerius zeteki TaxID=64791 RepID=A0A151WQC4_9HYME|nr:Beta-1-syntrophin [Trachymyrmex zeteki]